MRGIGAGTRIFDLLDRKPAIPPSHGVAVPTTRLGTVRFENIQFEYPSRKGIEILSDFSLEIGAGESVAIVLVFSSMFVCIVLTTAPLGERAEGANPQSIPCSSGTMTL